MSVGRAVIDEITKSFQEYFVKQLQNGDHWELAPRNVKELPMNFLLKPSMAWIQSIKINTDFSDMK